MSIEIRALTADEFSVHDELIFQAYKEYDRDGQEDRWWSQIVTRDPYYTPEQSQVLLSDGVMVASVTTYWRECYCAGRQARIGAIGSVATHPDHRRKGYVRMLMETARQWMLDNAFDFCFLFGREAVYGGSGYRMFSAFNASVTTRVSEGDTGLTVRLARFPEDIPALSAIYDDFSAALTGPILRSRAYWETRVTCGYFRDNTTSFYLLEDAGRPVAYFRSVDPGSVPELGWLRSDPGLAARAMGAILQQWPDAEQVSFGGWNSDLMAALEPHLWAPTQAAYGERAATVRLHESSKGMWTYVGPGQGLFPEVADTETMMHFLRANEYTFWSGVDNF